MADDLTDNAGTSLPESVAINVDSRTSLRRSRRFAHSELIPLPGVFNSTTSSASASTEDVDDESEAVKTMAPRPDGDLFIEPAGDYDVVYGDYNSTMDDGTGKRPYLRLTSHLPNVTRSAGGEVRLKCEVAGSPLPIHFAWLKNLAPLERNPRVRVRNKDYWSKLVISGLDVLDSGYYQCTATNPAGAVNSTAVLRVNPSSAASSSASGTGSVSSTGLTSSAAAQKHSTKNHKVSHASRDFGADDYYNYDSKDYPDELKSENRGFLMDVPKSAGGLGYAPVALDRWLENRTLRKGECVLYQGTSCSQFLAGKHVKLNTENREDVYDIDRHLTAAIMFIKNMPNVSDSCKRYSHAVACYHLFKVCDRSIVGTYGAASLMSIDGTSDNVIYICKTDCDTLQTTECPNEFAMAAQHELIGDGPKALLPRCDALPADAEKCIRVMEPIVPSYPSNAYDNGYGNHAPSSSSGTNALCYDGDGRNYEGPVARTKSQKPCLLWPQHTSTQFNTNVYPKLKHARNHCRNPDGRRPEPFCYTDPLSTSAGAVLVEEACDIPRCPLDSYRSSADGGHRPASDGSRLGGGGHSPPLLDSLASVWRSLSPEQFQLVVALGVGGVAMLTLLLLCCLCCCCCRRNERRRKSSTGGSATATGGGCGASSVNAESASSMISGTKKNGQFIRINGAGSSAGNSDVNNAFLQKMRDDRLRNGCGGDAEVLNPLLNPSDQFLQQQQMFEMQQQNYRWMGNGGGSIAGGASLQYAYAHHSLPHHPALQFVGNGAPLPPAYANQQPPPPQPFIGHPNNISGGSPHTSTEPPAEPYQIPTIQEHELHFDDERGLIGEDTFTLLFQGEWTGNLISGNALHVAIKTLKPNVNKVAVENFRDEIKELGPFEHINVLRMYGVAYLSQQNISAVFDYMVHGDLHEFLKVREPRAANKNDEEEHLHNAEDFLRISTQIIAGMEYLASSGYVHKDLAARNCLVADQQIVKIADFARLKSIYDKDYYRINQGMKMPLRWLSREAFNEGKYSQASDVYAFGVTMWEIYTYGRQPYDNFSDQQVIDMLSDDLTLESPSFCPPIIYSVIMNCTNSDPKRRPTFAELHPRFQKWCSTGQTQALLPGGRASSVHSGSSGSAAMQRQCRQMAPPVSSYTTSTTTNNSGQPTSALLRGSFGGLLSDQPFSFAGGSVPSPAPNATSGSGGIAKLTMLSGGVTNKIVHSTPIGHNVGKPHNGYSYSDEDDYSSNDSR